MNEYSKYLSVKSAIEDLFGSTAWYALKESNHVPTWRKYAKKTLLAVRLAITDTVEICDEQWMDDVCTALDRGIDELATMKSIDEVVGVLAGTMIEVSFWQAGNMPRCKGRPVNNALRKGAWKLDGHRSVVYVQSKQQKEALFLAKQRRRIGFEEQFTLQEKYHRSKSTLPYSEWCVEHEVGFKLDGT